MVAVIDVVPAFNKVDNVSFQNHCSQRRKYRYSEPWWWLRGQHGCPLLGRTEFEVCSFNSVKLLLKITQTHNGVVEPPPPLRPKGYIYFKKVFEMSYIFKEQLISHSPFIHNLGLIKSSLTLMMTSPTWNHFF